jgi:hypothetical protein
LSGQHSKAPGSAGGYLLKIGSRDARTIRGDDFYSSPSPAVIAICNVERLVGPIWEPACGNGAISKVPNEHGYGVVSTDLVPRGYGTGRIDFLMKYEPKAPNIITNPPYKLADQFAERAVRSASGKVAFLMRMAWLEGQRRRRLFKSMPFARLWVFSARLAHMHRYDYDGPKTSSTIPFAWFVWDKSHVGKPTVGWL